MDFVVGTRNLHKIEELTRILGSEIQDVRLIPAVGEGPVEDGDSFRANALIKARAAYQDSGLPSIADDSGLEVEALDGRPGIFSARYAPSGEDSDNTAKVLAEMAEVTNRRAAFVCAAALVFEGGEVVVEARWAGHLTDSPSGKGGFGYDPIFVPEGLTQTSAELLPEEKDALSHRGQAFRALARHMAQLGQN
jgi:XTP/dITP diphosphohydrolase